MASKENIYSSIQNLYNMDKNTWQEVLAEMYNLIYQNESKFEVIETKFDIHLNETVKNSLIDSIENGDFNELIENICKKIVAEVENLSNKQLLEIGPVGGAITKYLYLLDAIDFKAVELDTEKVEYLHKTYPQLVDKIINKSILDIKGDENA